MKLFGYKASPFVRHVRIALLQTQTPAEFIEIDGDYSAKHSPSMKVPFLKDGELTLNDSTAIVRYIREQAGQQFLSPIKSLDNYCLINTLLDSTINLFLLERDGLNTQNIAYFDRQRARIQGGLHYLNDLALNKKVLDPDEKLRLQCFLAWGLFRERLSLKGLDNLQATVNETHNDEFFMLTKP